MKFLILSLILVSCSQVNKESKDYYMGKHKVRHGLIPRTFDASKMKKEKSVLAYNSKKANKGAELYKSHCIECHGKNGRGNGPKAKDMAPAPADLVKTINEVPRFEFFMSLSQWKGEMPGWKNMFSIKETEALAHYLKKLASLQ